MNISRIQLMYFSPTGGTKKIATRIATTIAERLSVSVVETRLTLPEARQTDYHCASDEMVILAAPTFAGRVPNKIVPDLRRILHFDGSPALAVVAFGNRSCGTAPEELADILEGGGAKVIAAAAFVCRHSFTDKIARKRPDREDKSEIDSFAERTAELVSEAVSVDELACFRGEIGSYYKPLKEDGTPADFLKAKPLTVIDKCYRCGLCVKVCTMGVIDKDCVTVNGTCIKCQACVHSCPTRAKYFDDEDFLSHVRMLETNFIDRAENKVFI